MKNQSIIIKQINLFLILLLSVSALALPLVTRATTLADGMNAAYVIGSGSASQDFTADTAGTTATTLRNPRGMAYDTTNNRLFIADEQNYRVLVFNTDSDGVLLDYTADFVLGQADFTTKTGTSTQSGMTNVRDLAFDSDREILFVSENNVGHRIMVYDLSGGITDGMNASYVLGQESFTARVIAVDQDNFTDIQAIAFDSVNDRLFVRDEDRLMLFDVRDNGSGGSTLCGELTTGLANGMNASCVFGQANFTAVLATTTQSGFEDGNNSSNLVGYDEANERLYAGDGENNRVLIYDLSGVISNGMNAAYVLGQADFTSNVPTADITPAQNKFTANSGLSGTKAFTYDGVNDRAFIVDGTGDRVMVFDMSGGITDGMNASWVIGQPSFTSIANASFFVGENQSNLASGRSITYFETGEQLYVAGSSGHRVTIWDLTPTVAAAGKGYIKPPLCEVSASPNSITRGEQSTLSWNVTWPTERTNTYYTKVPGEGLFSSKVNSVNIQPDHSTTYTLYTFNLWGATPCTTTIQVLDENGLEVTSTPSKSHLTASAANSSFFRPIISFFASIFVR